MSRRHPPLLVGCANIARRIAPHLARLSASEQIKDYGLGIPACLAKDTLNATAYSGPLFDGDVPSKSGRDELVDLGLVARALKILRAED